MKIHPIVMFPFVYPESNSDLNALKVYLDDLRRRPDLYAEPVTVVNRQTFYRNRTNSSFTNMYKNFSECSTVIDAWSVDTCQMWLAGMGYAFDADGTNKKDDIYWLIPGDFNYSSKKGKETLDRFHELPMKVYNKEEVIDLCIGEIRTSRDDSKELIDTYSTYALLYNWFPNLAQKMRLNGIRKPRSEFFALSGHFLELAMIRSRWYAYEETVVLLLLAMANNRKVAVIELTDIRDHADDRDNPASALQQAERTERVLKHYWRECKIQDHKGWEDEFEKKITRSTHIMNSAKVILNEALPPLKQVMRSRF